MSKKTPTKISPKKAVAQKKVQLPHPAQNRKWFLALIGILIITYFVYAPALKNTLTGWDDKDYITINKQVKQISADSLNKFFSFKTGYVMGNYHPLTMITYAMEYKNAKLNPYVYHRNNLYLHLINILLVFVFISLLTKNNYAVAFITSLLFAIHPMHVESVAWVAERKDLLYTLFELAALCCYILFARNTKKNIAFYLLALLFFLLAILSKGMAVAMAVLLPLLDYYLGRKLTDVKLWLEKIPFFILAIIFGLVAIKAQEAGKALNLVDYSFYDRILFACYGILTYLWKCILPVGLSCFYDYPTAGTYSWYFVFVLLTIGIIYLIYRFARKSKEVVFGLLFFLFTIGLVLQVIPVGGAIIAERYTYIPYIGLFFIAAMFIVNLYKNNKPKAKQFKPVVIAVFAIISIAFAIGSYNRCAVWKDTLTIWNDALEKYPNCIKGLNGRGDAYNEKQQYELAVVDLDKALQLKQDYPDAFYNRGISNYYIGKQLLDGGKKDQALPYFDKAISDNTNAIKFSPELSLAYFNRSGNYFTIGKYKEALADANKAKELGMEVDPEYFKALESCIQSNTTGK